MLETGEKKREPILEMRNITKMYAGTVALDRVSLIVYPGEVHGVIGKNGAGKSTLVGVISGLITPDSGEIRIGDERYAALSPITAKRHRISIITQEPQVVENSTVVENLYMPFYDDAGAVINWKKLSRDADRILREVGFPLDVQTKMRDLSISERQILLVIKACFIELSDIIIMDEVSASLGQRDQLTLYRIIASLRDAGKTVIFISHQTEELLRVCTCVTVIRDGRNVGSEDVKNLDKKSLAALIVGDTDYDELAFEDLSSMIREEEAFSVDNFTSYGQFRDVSLHVKKGEIVGLAGLRGSGRTEILKSIVGINPFDEGEIRVEGKRRRYSSPAAAGADGIVYLTEERETEGLIPTASIMANLSIGILGKLSNFLGLIHGKREKSLADDLIRRLGIKTISSSQEISQLSGGNKQKTLIGRIMACRPSVCLLDEPTRGVDIEAKESILESINRELRHDACVIITSPGVEDLMKICDRIVVIYEGKIIDSFDRASFSEQDIYRAMQGEKIHAGAVSAPAAVQG